MKTIKNNARIIMGDSLSLVSAQIFNYLFPLKGKYFQQQPAMQQSISVG